MPGLLSGTQGALTINTADVADDAITLAKMAPGTDGQIITYDASGNPSVVGPGTDGQVLTSTGAGSPPAFEAIPAATVGREYLGHQDLSGGSWTLTDLDSSQYNFYEIWMHNYGNSSNPAYAYLQIGDGAGGSPTWRTDSTYSSHYREATSTSYHTLANSSAFGGSGHMSFGYMTTPAQTCKITFSGHKNIGTDGAANGYVTYELEDWRWRHNGGDTNMSIGYRAKGFYRGSTNAYEALRWVYVAGSFTGGTLYYWGIR